MANVLVSNLAVNRTPRNKRPYATSGTQSITSDSGAAPDLSKLIPITVSPEIFAIDRVIADPNGNSTNWNTANSKTLPFTVTPTKVTIDRDLHVDGTITASIIKVTTGAGAGKLLVSDADGVMSFSSAIVVSPGKIDIDRSVVVAGTVSAGNATDVGHAVNKGQLEDNTFSPSLLDVSMRDGYVRRNIGSESYSSGFAGSGWRMDTADNRLSVDHLTVRKSMDVYELIINQIRATNGSLWVSDSAKITSVTDGGSYWKCNLDTDGGNAAPPFVPDDWIRCQKWTGRSVKYYSAKVTSVGADYFNITKTGIDGAGTPAAGDTVVRIGNATNSSRQGAIYLTSSDSNSPYMDVLDGVVSASLAGKTKVRLGKLDGITDPQMGSLIGYGLYADNVYLKGIIYVTGGNAETQIGAQSKASAAQTAAINAAAADATTKANAAQTSSENYASGLVSGLQGSLGAMAYENLVNLAKLDSTIIQGGYIKSSLLDVNTIRVTGSLATLTDAQGYASNAQNAAAADATAKIAAVKLGGKNLVLNSTERIETNTYYLGSIDLSENIEDGTELTITAWGNLPAGKGLYVGLYPSTADLIIHMPKNGNVYSGTFIFKINALCPNDVRNKLVLYNAPNDGNFSGYIDKVKVEKGNKATDWTPAPEDVADDATAKANAAQTSAQNYASGLVSGLQGSLGAMAYENLVNLAKLDSTIIQGGYIKSSLLDVNTIRVTGSLATITEAQGYANSAQTVAATDATNKVNAVQIGGRNLIPNSNVNFPLAIYPAAQLIQQGLSSPLVIGQTYIFSAKRLVRNGYTELVLVDINNNWHLIQPNTPFVASQEYSAFFFYTDGTAQVALEKPKLELGNKPTDYTVAPEDVAADATAKANAAQTSAQNYASGLYNSLNAAKQDAIVNGQTLIIGGYLNTDFIQAGSIVASKIVFDGATGNNVNLTGKITASTGKIGGFNISGSGIVNDDGLAYVICRNTADGREAMIGTSVFPLAGSGVSYFRNELYNPYANNYAVYAKARNAGTQYSGENGYYAGYFDGHVKVVNGDLEVSGQMNGIWNIPDSHIYHMGNAVIVNNLPAGYYLYVGDNKTANRDYQLPDAGSYKAGTVIRIVNWNNQDAYIRPYNTQTINGYTKEQRYITLSDASSTACLRSNGSNQWTIIYLAGTSVGF